MPTTSIRLVRACTTTSSGGGGGGADIDRNTSSEEDRFIKVEMFGLNVQQTAEAIEQFDFQPIHFLQIDAAHFGKETVVLMPFVEEFGGQQYGGNEEAMHIERVHHQVGATVSSVHVDECDDETGIGAGAVSTETHEIIENRDARDADRVEHSPLQRWR